MRRTRSRILIFLLVAALALFAALVLPRQVANRIAAEGAPPTVPPEGNARPTAQGAPAESQTPVSGAAAFDIPPEVAGHEKEWPLANHDYANTRAAVGSSINASNVANLKVAWTSPLNGTSEWGGGTGNPVVSDGVVYVQDLAANTYAVDLKMGQQIWEKQYDNQIFGPSGPGLG